MTKSPAETGKSVSAQLPLAHRWWRHIFSICALIASAGCAAIPEVRPLPDSIRSDMRSIAITVTTHPEAVTVWRPTASSGAREGANAAIEAANVLTMGLWPIFFYGVGTIAVPSVGAAIGYLLGTIKEPPQAEVQRAESMLRGLAEKADIKKIIGEAVMTKISETAPQIRTMIAGDGVEDPPMAASLVNRNSGTVLELNITKLEVAGPWGSDPAKKVAMTVAARIVRSGDGSILYSQDFGFIGNRDVEEWYLTATDGHENSRALQEALIQAAETLGKDITRALFSSKESSREKANQSKDKGEQNQMLLNPKHIRTGALTLPLQRQFKPSA